MPGTALVAALALLAVPADGWVSLDLGLVGTEARAAKVAPTEAGLQLEVDHRAFLSFPGPGAQWLELTVQSGSDLSLLYGTVRDGQFRAGPPQRGGRNPPRPHHAGGRGHDAGRLEHGEPPGHRESGGRAR